MEVTSSYLGLMTFLSFVLSVGAAALAINLYALLRTGSVGASWRILIIASVMFALLQAVRLAEFLGMPFSEKLHLSSIIELAFVLTLAYAFWLQRQVFAGESRREKEQKPTPTEDVEESVVSTYENYN